MSPEARPREDNLKLRTRKVLVTKSGFVHIVHAPTAPDPLTQESRRFIFLPSTWLLGHSTSHATRFCLVLLTKGPTNRPQLRCRGLHANSAPFGKREKSQLSFVPALWLEDLATRWRTQKARPMSPSLLCTCQEHWLPIG